MYFNLATILRNSREFIDIQQIILIQKQKNSSRQNLWKNHDEENSFPLKIFEQFYKPCRGHVYDYDYYLSSYLAAFRVTTTSETMRFNVNVIIHIPQVRKVIKRGPKYISNSRSSFLWGRRRKSFTQWYNQRIKVHVRINIPFPAFFKPSLDLEFDLDFIISELDITRIPKRIEAPWIKRVNKTLQFTETLQDTIVFFQRKTENVASISEPSKYLIQK